MEVRRTGFAFSDLSACVRDTQRGCEWIEGSIRPTSFARVSIVGNPSKTRDQPDVWEGVYHGTVFGGREHLLRWVRAVAMNELTLREAVCGHCEPPLPKVEVIE